jgi:preprotein translocase subunit SecA
MEHLRDGIGLRGYGQRDPKQEYKKEGYDVFMTMMASTSSNVCSKVFKVQVRRENEIERIEREDAERHATQQRAMQMRHGSEPEASEEEGPAAPRPSARPAQPRVTVQPVRRDGPKVGRNDPCPCGSGQKFKKCHGAALEEDGDPADLA